MLKRHPILHFLTLSPLPAVCALGVAVVTVVSAQASTSQASTAQASTSQASTSRVSTAQPSAPFFREVAKSVGLKFEHQGGRDGDYYFPEVMGSGVALFDADGDGDLDLYLANFGKNQLWRNRGAGTLDDVTDAGFLRRLTSNLERYRRSEPGSPSWAFPVAPSESP